MQFNRCAPVVNIANDTTVGAVINVNAAADIIVSGQRIDWDSRYVKSVQFFQVTLNGVTSNTATITAVDVNNSFILNAGTRGDQADRDYSKWATSLFLTNGTTVTGQKGVATGSTVTEGYVVEFYPGVLANNAQHVTGTIASGSNSSSIAITPVSTNKFLTFVTGYRVTSASTDSRLPPLLGNTVGSAINITRGAVIATDTICNVDIIDFKDTFLSKVTFNEAVVDTSTTISGSTTISIVNLNKAIMAYEGMQCEVNSISMGPVSTTVKFSNSTTVFSERGSLGANRIVNFVSFLNFL